MLVVDNDNMIELERSTLLPLIPDDLVPERIADGFYLAAPNRPFPGSRDAMNEWRRSLPFTINFFVLYYCLEGELTVRANGTEYHVSSG